LVWVDVDRELDIECLREACERVDRGVVLYINQQAQGTRVLLFVRERKYDKLGTQPFYFLGR
jgi:hypothetical protein